MWRVQSGQRSGGACSATCYCGAHTRGWCALLICGQSLHVASTVAVLDLTLPVEMILSGSFEMNTDLVR